MKKIRELGNKVLAIIIVVELAVSMGLAYDIVRTVRVNQENVVIQQNAENIAHTILNTNVVKKLQKTAKKGISSAKSLIEDAYVKIIESKAKNLEYVKASCDTGIESSKVYKVVQGAYTYSGTSLSKSRGTTTGPNGKETYYNLNMSGVVSTMRRMGFTDAYWVRSDGCKMLGNYVMIAANLSKHPRGSIVKTSVGLAIVCDTGGFAKNNPNQVDIATNW